VVPGSKKLSSLMPPAALVTIDFFTRKVLRSTTSSRLLNRASELVLAVGQQEVIDARKVKSYSVGDPDHVEVKLTPDGTKFVIVARKAGKTSLLLLRDCGDDLRFTIRIAK
jgi:hypothetical protein